MAKRTIKRQQVTERFEPLEVEIRTPTIVLSVRLDEATAKQLHRWAKQRGVRVSDILREAAMRYAKAGPEPATLSYIVDGGATVSVGVSSRATEAPREARQTTSESPPRSAWTTTALTTANSS